MRHKGVNFFQIERSYMAPFFSTIEKKGHIMRQAGRIKKMADAAKKITLEDLQEIIRDLGESQKELSESQKELSESQKELSESQKITEESLQKTQKEIRESQKELSESQKELSESQKTTEESLQKTQKEIRESQKTTKNLESLFSGQWGKLMESLIEGDLIKLLRNRNILVNQVTTRRRGETNGKQWEIDLIAINGDEIVVVEVKTTLKVQDVKNFQDKILVPIKTLIPEYSNFKIYGAIAYLRADQKANLYAQKQGLFVIRATGSSASITNEKGFKPAIY